MTDAAMTLDPALRARLAEAAQGLLYSSEGDHPFEPFDLGAHAGKEPLTAERFAELVGAPAGTPVEERTLDELLGRHILYVDAHDVEAQKLRPRYERLAAVIREGLRDVRVFRVGRVVIRCYIVGFDERGTLGGLVTTAIET